MRPFHLTAALGVLALGTAGRAGGAAPSADPFMLAIASPVDAPEDDAVHPGRFFLGARGNINGGSGEPANDMPGYGAFGRYRVSGPWLLGLAVDQSTFDFETPGNLIDVQPVGIVDAEIDSTTVTAWGEYEFPPLADDGLLGRLRPFVGAGIGVAFLGDDDVSGPTEGGGTFAFDVSGGTEIVPGVVVGLRFDLHRNVVLELGARADYHFTDLDVRDDVTGNSAGVDDYETYGAYVGLLLRW